MCHRGESLKNLTGEYVVFWGTGISHGHRTDESEANAKLIAASPEMYEEIQIDLNRLIGSISCFSGHHRAEIKREIKRKEKLLAKARGE
jgi:hypothetical protein